jgi:hypothetical protein
MAAKRGARSLSLGDAIVAVVIRKSVDGLASVRGATLAGFGPVGRRGDGLQFHANLEGGGFVSVVHHSVDRFEPLIIRYGIAEAAATNASSCCMTEIDCGGGLKCLTAEDPCPTGTGGSPWEQPSGATLFASEVALLRGLTVLAERVTRGQLVTKADIENELRRLRERHAHRELVATYEPDSKGAWIDWILRLSDSSAVHIRISTNRRRTAPVFGAGVTATMGAIRGSRVSAVPSDRGLLVLQPRLFVD